MRRRAFVTLQTELPSFLDPLPESGGPIVRWSPGEAYTMRSLERFQQRINEVTLVPFTRLELRQVLTSLGRIEQLDHGADLAFDGLREKLRIAVQRMA